MGEDGSVELGITQAGTTREAEGFHGYERIEQILKLIFGSDHGEYLQRFKREMVDDATIFDNGEFLKIYPNHHAYWSKLIPKPAPRLKFFRLVREHRSYADV